MRRSRILCGLMLVLMHGCLLLCVGCDLFKLAKPETTVTAGIFGFRFYDTKDNDVEIKGALYNHTTHDFTVESLTIRNNASDPAAVYVQQMQVLVEQQRAFNEGITATFQGLSGVINQLAGVATQIQAVLPRRAATQPSE